MNNALAAFRLPNFDLFIPPFARPTPPGSIAQIDLTSDKLKNKKHWNTFAGPFFLESADIIALLERDGHVAIDRAAAKALESGPMACHRCGQGQRDIPSLKRHIAACVGLFPPASGPLP